MRISKYQPVVGFGIDRHGALPPIIPTPPPAGPNPAPIPTVTWINTITVPYAAAITGKWSMASVQTEGLGDILWMYDWGPGQPHLPIGPPLLSPSIALLVLGSTAKYWMASHAITEHVDGGSLALISGGEAAVAVSLPISVIPGEDCWDVASALSFVVPSSVLVQLPSVRWVGFNRADLLASAIAMAGDALAAMIISKFGPSGKQVLTQLLGGLASTFITYMGNILASLPPIGTYAASGWVGLILRGATVEGASPLGWVALAPIVTMWAGQLGGWVGESWGSDEHGDGVTQPDPDDAPQPHRSPWSVPGS